MLGSAPDKDRRVFTFASPAVGVYIPLKLGLTFSPGNVHFRVRLRACVRPGLPRCVSERLKLNLVVGKGRERREAVRRMFGLRDSIACCIMNEKGST